MNFWNYKLVVQHSYLFLHFWHLIKTIVDVQFLEKVIRCKSKYRIKTIDVCISFKNFGPQILENIRNICISIVFLRIFFSSQFFPRFSEICQYCFMIVCLQIEYNKKSKYYKTAFQFMSIFSYFALSDICVNGILA